MSKELTIVAGPNGAGKTTFSMELIDEGVIKHFINADEIAKSLIHTDPKLRNFQAGRLFLTRLNQAIKAEQNVCFETTLSGLSYIKLIKRLKQNGWSIKLYYLALKSVDLSILRVEERVLHGGHDIPIKDIKRRFPKSLHNLFEHYLEVVDTVYCILNTNEPDLIFTKKNDNITIFNESHFNHLRTIARSRNE